MAEHGGYRPPTNPAPASGPGALSRRTDGGAAQPIRDLPDPDYGEGATFRRMQAGAPMAAGSSPPAGPTAPPLDLSRAVPLSAPSQRPGEPVTAGAAAGPGPGVEALGSDPGVDALPDQLAAWEMMASLPTASRAFQQFYRYMRARA